jgi:DNA-binding transcriptional LysR family regulator
MVIELRLIRHALAVGRHGNFARAAEALHLTQPSLSRSIAALESMLGVPLFDRSTKGVTPTAFGCVLLERGETVLRREADLRREIALLAGLEAGTLTVAAGPHILEVSVAIAVGRLAKAHPGLQIACMAADPAAALADVLAERSDVGVAAIDGLEQEPRLVVEAFAPRRGILACRPTHPLTREKSPSLARVLEFPLVTTRLRGAQAALMGQYGVPMRQPAPGDAEYVPPILVNSFVAARLIARESDAIVTGTAATLADDIANGHLVALDCFAPGMETRQGCFYLRERTLSPAARRFVDLLRQVEAETHAEEDALASRRRKAVARSRARAHAG